MLHVLFGVGGLVFWILFAVFLVCEAGLLVGMCWVRSVLIPISFLVILLLFSDLSLAALTGAVCSIGWLAILKWVGMYVACGVVWAAFYWWLQASKRSRKILALKDQWIRANSSGTGAGWKMTEIAMPQRVALYTFIKDGIRDNGNSIHGGGFHGFLSHSDESPKDFSDRVNREFLDMVLPLPSRNKALISGWMSGWPLVMLWWALGDLLQEFWGALCRATRTVFTAISRFAFRKFTSQF